jgi:SAM-dependent methyltransferase
VKAIRGQQRRDVLHEFWRRPDRANAPEDYLMGAERSELLVDLVKRHAGPDVAVLEIGCNAGRNLQFLLSAGFSKLTGIEISEAAIRVLRERLPAVAATARLFNEPVEAAIKGFRDGEFGVVYTMAVLEHLHPDSEWVFEEMVRITNGVLITIEDERGVSWRHFPRDYSRVFGALGLTLVETVDCATIDGLGPDFRARVFRRPIN